MIAVTLDSNIYFSALQFGGVASRLPGMARMGRIRIHVSDAIVSETIGVLRDKFGWEGYQLHFTRLKLLQLANLVSPLRTLRVCDDPDDDRILECATGNSDFIITEDKDLLRLGVFEGIPILRAREFPDRVPML